MPRRYLNYLEYSMLDIIDGLCVVIQDTGQVSCQSKQQVSKDPRCPAHEPTSTFWLEPLLNNSSATFTSVNATIHSISTMLTNHMLVFGSDVYAGTKASMAVGNIETVTTCIQFRWQWLLGWGIAADQMDPMRPVWKNSLFPLLFYGQEGSLDNREKHIQGLDRLEAIAEKTVVVLRYGNKPGFICEAAHSRQDYE